jgi:RNA polymerase sigma-70 factor, ECF subfamily
MQVGHSIEDRQLLKEAKSGDAEAFGELYERYAPGIFRFLFVRLENRMDAEDLTEDVFFKTWQSLPGYSEKGLPFAAYLYRIANNVLIDYYRKKPDHQFGLDDQAFTDPCPEPIEQVSARFDRHHLRKTLDGLRDDYRTVIMARFISDLSHEETARMMGKSTGAVRVLQHRALSTLRKKLDGAINGNF